MDDRPQRTENRRVYMKAYYEAHKAELVALNKAYRETHKAEKAARDKAYRETHRAEYAAYREAYRETHKAECAASAKAYREAHRAERAARAKAYQETHKAEKRSRARRRIAILHKVYIVSLLQKKGIPPEDTTPEMIEIQRLAILIKRGLKTITEKEEK